jgi:DNA (cytosine-5)-methyltransferase 1
MSVCRPGLADDYPDLVAPTREALQETGLQWVIENVPGSPVRPDLMLCGHMFGLKLYRHRLFELSTGPLFGAQPAHPPHLIPGSRAGHWRPGQIISVSGNCSPIALAREAMGIGWMNRTELAESIPPAYTAYVGAQLLQALECAA